MRKLIFIVASSLFLFLMSVPIAHANDTMTYKNMQIRNVDNERDVVTFLAEDDSLQDIHHVPMKLKSKLRDVIDKNPNSNKRYDVTVSNGNVYVQLKRVANNKSFVDRAINKVTAFKSKINTTSARQSATDTRDLVITGLAIVGIVSIIKWVRRVMS